MMSVEMTPRTLALLGTLLAALPAGARDSGGLPREGIDLLRLIDVEKDAVAGTWTLDGKTLVSPSLQFGRLAVPYVVPEEYDLRIVAERRGPGNSLSVGLSQGGRQFLVIFDGVEREPKTGLDLVDGKPFYDNATTYRGGVTFSEVRPTTVVIAVRQKRVLVLVDGRPVVDWKGDPARLSLWASWFMHRQDTLFLGAWTSPQRVRRMELFPVRGRGKPLR